MRGREKVMMMMKSCCSFLYIFPHSLFSFLPPPLFLERSKRREGKILFTRGGDSNGLLALPSSSLIACHGQRGRGREVMTKTHVALREREEEGGRWPVLS